MNPILTWNGKHKPLSPASAALFCLTETYHACSSDLLYPTPDKTTGMLVVGDNLLVMEWLLKHGFAGKINLVYCDPPFQSGVDYHKPVRFKKLPKHLQNMIRKHSGPCQYRDHWHIETYLQNMYTRLWRVRELMAETGSIIIHTDWHASHYWRCMLDEVFGTGAHGSPGFRNEVVWGYGGGSAPRNYYPRKHDSLLWYSKSSRWTFNKQFRPYTSGTLQRGLTQSKGDSYQLHVSGAGLDDYWVDTAVQKILSPNARENVKYPTQKPITLMNRILTGHSNPQDIVFDYCCGSGSMLVAAQQSERAWIGCDCNPVASTTAALRLTRTRQSEDKVVPFEVWQSGCSEGDTSSSSAEVSVRLKPRGQHSTLNIESVWQPLLSKWLPISQHEYHQHGGDWRCFVEAVLIDTDYHGKVLQPSIVDYPDGHQALVKGEYAWQHKKHAWVRLKVIDILGCVTIWDGYCDG